jgi:hypothetical protein
MNHCCEVMAKAVRQRCDDHETVFECPDALIYYSQRFDDMALSSTMAAHPIERSTSARGVGQSYHSRSVLSETKKLRLW